MLDIRGLSVEDLTDKIQSINIKKFRAKQIFDWLWKKNILDFELMHNLPKEDIIILKENFKINSLSIKEIERSSDDTLKVLFQTFDNQYIEGVLIPSENRFTACISSQVGCSLACEFCATGTLKRVRNLYSYEIYDQAKLINDICLENFKNKLTNIVYMGMGEPLLNYDNVILSAKYINNTEYCIGLSSKKITISTSGIIRNIEKMITEDIKLNLAISLHASNNELRSSLMDINTSNPLEKLILSLKNFYDKTKCKITFEYILLGGVNDSTKNAKELVEYCKDFPVYVNLIEYNKVEGKNFVKSKKENRDNFLKILKENNINCKIRKSRGKDINAACGQLANKTINSTK